MFCSMCHLFCLSRPWKAVTLFGLKIKKSVWGVFVHEGLSDSLDPSPRRSKKACLCWSHTKFWYLVHLDATPRAVQSLDFWPAKARQRATLSLTWIMRLIPGFPCMNFSTILSYIHTTALCGNKSWGQQQWSRLRSKGWKQKSSKSISLFKASRSLG